MPINIFRSGLCVVLAALLAACGGGGGSSGSDETPAASAAPTPVFRFFVRQVGDQYATVETQTTNLGAVTTTARSFLVTSADAAGDSTISVTLTNGGAALSTVTVAANPGGGGIETVTAPDGSLLSNETVDPLKADVDQKVSATEDCSYSNGRDLTPKSYTVGATWTDSGVLTCTDSSIAANNFSGPYSGSGSVVSQENVTVAGTVYTAFNYSYTETFNRLDQNSAIVFTEVFTTTCDFVPTLKLTSQCATKYNYTGQIPSTYLVEDSTQLVSASIH
jgi:hypothetical protein